MSIELRPLSAALGVELRGVDVRAEQPPDVRTIARDALLEHGLVLVRGQEVTLEEQLRFAEWFGPVNTRGYSFGADVEMYISNSHQKGVAREGSLLLHQDHCFFEQPLPAICLYAEEVTRRGGATIFADARRAYDRLPDGLRRRLASLEALHLYDYANDYGDQRFRVATASPEAPRAVHPVVLHHVETGRPILYVNRLMTDSIVGLAEDQSDALLDELMTYFEGDDVRYEHTWQRHDLVVWDNLALQHGRTEFPPDERRCLRRIQVG
jgi:taurine dioxygenase